MIAILLPTSTSQERILFAQSNVFTSYESRANNIAFFFVATEAAKETTETPAAETTEAAKEEAKEETKKEVVPVENGQLEHKGSNFPKYASTIIEQIAKFPCRNGY